LAAVGMDKALKDLVVDVVDRARGIYDAKRRVLQRKKHVVHFLQKLDCLITLGTEGSATGEVRERGAEQKDDVRRRETSIGGSAPLDIHSFCGAERDARKRIPV